MKKVSCFCAVVLLFLMSVGCKPTIPGKYLQPDMMAEILYDYHIAEGVVNATEAGDTLALRSFKSNILSKYGVSEADFYSSMVYYTRHTKLLEDVYQKLEDRLNVEANAQGSTVGGADGYLLSGDTANVWNNPTCFVLSPYVVTNRESFEIVADSSFHNGDRILFDFDTQYIFQDGMRDAQAVMAVTYRNDSVEYVTSQLSGSSHYHMQINNDGRLGIKSVKGFWIMNNNSAYEFTSVSTLKLLIVSNVRLVRMHAPDDNDADGHSTNNADTSNIVKIDSMKRRR